MSASRERQSAAFDLGTPPLSENCGGHFIKLSISEPSHQWPGRTEVAEAIGFRGGGKSLDVLSQVPFSEFTERRNVDKRRRNQPDPLSLFVEFTNRGGFVPVVRLT